MVKRIRHIALVFFMLLLGGVVNEAWAANVTYHILTLPIDPSRYDYKMKDEIEGWRLEAVKVVVNNQTTVELPAQYKSPLVSGFTYYNASDITKYSDGAAQNLFANGPVKGVLYKVSGEDTPSTADDPTPVTESTTISGSTAEYYVVYTYDASNEIAKLDGSVKYNIRTKYKDNKVWKDRGFFALNRGRNNRPAVLQSANINPEMLSSEDFMVAPVTGTGVSPYWKDGNNKNKEADVASQFYFMFKFEGYDPYNIIIRTTYNRPYTYIEKNDGTNNFVYKWYKEASLFAVSSGNNCYIASDEHKKYKTAWVDGGPNPIDPAYDDRPGNYHGQSGVIWNSVALLPNSDNSGYVFMATRAVDGDGAIGNTIYYLKQKDNCNNLNFASGNSTDNLTIEGLYPIKNLTFKVVTPFGNVVSVSDQISQYTVDNDVIETKYLPNALKRKYIKFNGKFYKDAACTQEITTFSEAIEDPTEGYQVYVGYEMAPDAPKFLSPSDDYSKATWYELTDEGSTQEYGRKIKYDTSTSTYKNNGANGEYVKESEFALVGDPYEVKVLYRKGTEDADSKTYVTLSENESWDIPDDDRTGSFLLRKFNDTGYWYWDAGHVSADVTYGSNHAQSAGKDAQTIMFNVSGLNGSKYYKITTGGADASEIVSVNPRVGYVYDEKMATTATVAVFLAENTSGADKTMTVTIQEYNDNEGKTASGSPSVITITQGTSSSSFTPSDVEYSTTNSTRVKVMELPTRTYTYNIVDKSGRIAVKASAEQTIFSKLSLASLPSIIISPFILDEELKFYDTYTDGYGRSALVGHEIPETPNVDHDIFVTYSTTNLDSKPINLSENQEFNVVLNGQYIYYDRSDGIIKSKARPDDSEKTSKDYLWKLRQRDPYSMLIDNLGAREKLDVAGQTENPPIYDDDGNQSTPTRQKGAWVKFAGDVGNDVALTFITDRAQAQQFIAKSSLQPGVYEVMVATGASVDASTTYYNIGRTSETAIKIYDNETYIHGQGVLKFQLEQTIDYSYHLIDKYDHELLKLSSQSPDLVLPAEYQSPLVATYHYYDKDNIDIVGDVHTVKDNPTELTRMSDLEATFTKTQGDYSSQWTDLTASSAEDVDDKAKKLKSTGDFYFRVGEEDGPYTYYYVNVTKACYTDIYVTYDVNNRVKFDKSSPYMLKFLQPHEYYLEDGKDKLTTSKIEAVYPYCNGDGSLNIYGDEMQKEQFGGGAATRPRWIWFFESEKKDPYHVMIHSSSTISFGGISHPTYLQTLAVDFVQGATTPKHVVTCGTLPTVASEDPTEYMVLGTEGQFRLRTTYTIDDGTSDMRRDVTSLEQYWKTYNMIKLDVLGISKNTDAPSDDESTWVVPTADDPTTPSVDESTYRTILAAKDWHSYAIHANATRWNGYNNKSDGHEKKCVEKIEHWFQTFDMGDGSFDIESASIPPVLILLDLRGWEIMRQPLPTLNYPEGDTELAALRAYDSPMVDKYYFYSNATKASGCHKYTMRLQDGKERDQIKVNGEHYSSTSLGSLPPITATGVKSSDGSFNDQYVIYTVKKEYVKSYDYTFTDNGDGTYTETETPSKFMMLQHGRFYKNETTADKSYLSKPIYEHTSTGSGNVYDLILDPRNNTVNIVNASGHLIGNCLWYVKPNQNIDKEMGIKYATVTGNSGEPWTELETKKHYFEKGKAGFDPYNLQIQLLNKNDGTPDGRYLTSHMTSASLHDGVMIGDYTGGTTYITLEAGHDYSGWDPWEPTTSVGHDQTNLTISNQTFMAVSDANGNMQLMPRFDHTKRVDLDGSSPWETTLEDPVNHPKASAEDNASMGAQTTFFVRPQIFEYQIINNDGNESLRYKRSGDYFPAITDHFKSPLAKDFTYYTGLAEYNDLPVSINSTKEEWSDATAEFKRTATTAELMNSQVNLLPTAGTYYYKIGTNYYKVEVTKGLLEKQITGSFADAGLGGDDSQVYVRYSYDEEADREADRILEGQWFTIKLANKDVQAVGTINVSTGAGVSLYAGNTAIVGDPNDKPTTVDGDDRKWQWKFLAAPMDSESEYYVAPDPYALQIFNRSANYANNLNQPSPMSVGVRVPNAADGADHFALLSHTSGGYALAVAGTGTYTYKFLNGADMTTPDAGEPVAATTEIESDFTQRAGIFGGVKSQLIVNNDVEHNFEYKVINNAGKLAISATQDNASAGAHQFSPYLPEAAQTPLLNMEDYKYYGFVTVNENGTVDTSDDTYTVEENTKLFILYGLYDDVVYVRYKAYDVDNTPFKVPNKKTIVDSHVARDPSSVDASLNINGELPYNIIWYNDNMMESDNDLNIIDGGSHALDGSHEYVWYFTDSDPYALKIEHKKTGGFLYSSDGSTCYLDNSNYTPFMLLKKSGYDYGVLQVTGGTKTLSGYGNSLVDNGAPTKFVIFGLSVHDLIYRLIIAKTCELSKKSEATSEQYVDIPYSANNPTPYDPDYNPTAGTLRVYGSTQRDLTTAVSGVAGDKYQLGETISWGGAAHTYSHHAGAVSIGDDLTVPNEFNRPNCTFEFYIEGIYSTDGTTLQTSLDDKYKGLKVDKLMSDAELIDKTVVVNIVYSFNKELATNNGLDFVRSVGQNLWYTYETQGGATPYLAHYTNAWGLQTMDGRNTRYTNDYLWTPLGDVYGFKLYNRYMIKNSDGSNKMMTFIGTVEEGKNLAVAEPGTSTEAGTYTQGNEIFELLPPGETDGYFRVHPVANTKEQTQYFIKRDALDSNYAKLSTTPSDWTFGLDMALLEPYYDRAGYIGGLTTTIKEGTDKPKSGKELYENALHAEPFRITDLQAVVYDDDNIVDFTSGFYRLHSVPGTPGVNPIRYASGYLHKLESDVDGNHNESDAIPMHFYSKVGVSATFDGDLNPLESGFTETPATRGDIPVLATEADPSTIFYLEGAINSQDPLDGVNPRVTMSSQGLYVKGNVPKITVEEVEVDDPDNGNAVMTATPGNATKFSLIGIGGAVFLITDKLAPADRKYLHYGQSGNKYDLKYYHNSPTNEARWCIEPADNQGLMVTTNNGGDGYYYTTFYAPFDVQLPADGGSKTYNAYIGTSWSDTNVRTAKVTKEGYTDGKFIPAGTPAIIRTTDESGNVKLAIPTSAPSEPLSSCVFSGSYLEQLLDVDADHDVYTLGLPFRSTVTKDDDYSTTGDIKAPLPEQANTGVGFYINATSNKEHNELKARWDKNNRYVLHNKIYYREPASSPPAPGLTRGIEFVPVIFDDDESEEELQPDGSKQQMAGDNCIYDLQGRKMATEQQVKNGTWRQLLKSGVYIINGKKIAVTGH